MVKIFTTQFHFNNQYHDAIITVVRSNEKALFHVKVLDMELYHLLPGGEATYVDKKWLKDQYDHDNALTQSLLQSIAKAIDFHFSETKT
ncbi:MAG TPA: hypothetical protein VEX63_05515 [Flavisolibacter sp.]|jgi:hypothetical protein|nr:hypothetical protein [Flavisolibacter sp.]